MQYSTGVILSCISVESLKYSFCLTLYFFVLESSQRKIEEKERTLKFLFFSSDFPAVVASFSLMRKTDRALENESRDFMSEIRTNNKSNNKQ